MGWACSRGGESTQALISAELVGDNGLDSLSLSLLNNSYGKYYHSLLCSLFDNSALPEMPTVLCA